MSVFKPFDKFGGTTQQCVLPLVAKVEDQIYPVGTGFVLNPDGLFVTAAHVLEEAESRAVYKQNDDGELYKHYEFYAIYIGNQRNTNSESYIGGLLPIDEVWAPIDLDIGFGWLRLPRSVADGKPIPLWPVCIRPAIPRPNAEITAMGYYKMAGSLKTNKEGIIWNHAQETAVSSGVIEEVYPVRRDQTLLSFPCFRTNARFDPGMSGGPIFDKSGCVIGVVCSGTEIEEPHDTISHGSLIWPIFGCEIEVACSPDVSPRRQLIYDLAKKGFVFVDETIHQIYIAELEDGKREICIR